MGDVQLFDGQCFEALHFFTRCLLQQVSPKTPEASFRSLGIPKFLHGEECRTLAGEVLDFKFQERLAAFPPLEIPDAIYSIRARTERLVECARGCLDQLEQSWFL